MDDIRRSAGIKLEAGDFRDVAVDRDHGRPHGSGTVGHERVGPRRLQVAVPEPGQVEEGAPVSPVEGHELMHRAIGQGARAEQTLAAQHLDPGVQVRVRTVRIPPDIDDVEPRPPRVGHVVRHAAERIQDRPGAHAGRFGVDVGHLNRSPVFRIEEELRLLDSIDRGRDAVRPLDRRQHLVPAPIQPQPAGLRTVGERQFEVDAGVRAVDLVIRDRRVDPEVFRDLQLQPARDASGVRSPFGVRHEAVAADGPFGSVATEQRNRGGDFELIVLVAGLALEVVEIRDVVSLEERGTE